jgi:hypothetical protein
LLVCHHILIYDLLGVRVLLLRLLRAADKAFTDDVDLVLLGSRLLTHLRLINPHSARPDPALETEALLVHRVARL